MQHFVFVTNNNKNDNNKEYERLDVKFKEFVIEIKSLESLSSRSIDALGPRNGE